MRRILTLIVILLSVSNLNSQIIAYQDVFKGGVTGDSFNPWSLPISGSFDIYIEPGSTIRKAFLFTTVYFSPIEETPLLNGAPVELNASNSFENEYLYVYNSDVRKMKTLMIDVTAYVDPNQNSYSISPLIQPSDLVPGIYTEFYLYLAYENPTMQTVCANVFVNNVQPNAIMTYDFNNLNPIDIVQNVGFAINASSFCNTVLDGSNVKINNVNLGLIGGSDDNGPDICTGVSSSFYYQNSTFFGLGNDTPDNTMNGVDAIASIETYLNSNNSFILEFDYQSSLAPKTNPIHQLFLAYSTPCDTFSVSHSQDTAICQGENVSLFATGGQAYKWEPATDLSCSTCPNPVFTGDSTQLYTVRIWNNDSCSVVRPIRVTVRQKPLIENIVLSNTICGTNTGVVSASSSNGNVSPISFMVNNGAPQASGSFLNLNEGTQTITLIDGYGCNRDSVVIIGQVNNTIAQFSANPITGAVPFSVNLTNTSVFADQFSWSLNGVNQGSTFSNFTALQTGSYLIELIAWQFDPACADTATLTITAFDSLMVQVPNIITANDDLINDFFTLTTNLPLKGTLSILNRWGEVVYTYNGKFQQGQTVLWDGKFEGKNVTEGTYFYAIELNEDPEFPLAIDKSQLPLKLEGFVEVRR